MVGNFSMTEFNDLLSYATFKVLELAAADIERVLAMTLTIKIITADGVVDAPVGMARVHQCYYDMLIGRALEKYENVIAVQIFIPDPAGKLPWDWEYDAHWGGHVQQMLLYKQADEIAPPEE
jgi:hypothetical protein